MNKTGIAVILICFFGLSVNVKHNWNEKNEPIRKNAEELFTVQLDLSGLQPLKAAESAWAFVRQSATWANNNTRLIESIILPIKNSGALNFPGSYTQTVASGTGISFIARLTVDANQAVPSAAYSGTKTYQHKFELWRSSDNAKAMEIFFDTLVDLSGDGVLMIYNLGVCDPLNFASDNVVVESYSFLNGDSKVQVYSWAGSISSGLANYANSDRGRVSLDTMDNNTVLCFKSVVRFTTGGADLCGGAGTNSYYSLAYSQNFASPSQATALVSLAVDSIDNSLSNRICGVSDLGFGLFRESGFISDGNSSVPADYPTAARVNTLFGQLNTVSSDGEWDDLTKATIDGLNTKVAFTSTAAP